jgi:hypothetical protein
MNEILGDNDSFLYVFDNHIIAKENNIAIINGINKFAQIYNK